MHEMTHPCNAKMENWRWNEKSHNGSHWEWWRRWPWEQVDIVLFSGMHRRNKQNRNQLMQVGDRAAKRRQRSNKKDRR